ncbi:MAG: type II toxin-antitoxin system VapC family toxin [Acetobacteraceae bacterium]
MARFVVDESVAIKWLVQEEGTAQALALRHHTLCAPDLLLPECANILWKKHHLDELTGRETHVCAGLLARAEVELVPMRGLMAHAMRLSLQLDHPAYECMYLALAQARDCAFVTADRRLIRRVRAEQPAGLVIQDLGEFAG